MRLHLGSLSVRFWKRLGVVVWLVVLGSRDLVAQDSAQSAETLETIDGRRLSGRLMIDARGRVGFQVSGTPEILPESSLRALTDEAREPKPAAGTPPFQVNLSPWGRISGRQADLSGREIRLEPGQGGARIKIAPGGASSIVQRPGEWQVLHDGFEALDVTRWSQGGSPVVSAEPHLAGARALRLPAGGASITTRLAEGIGSGRLEVAFFDDGGKVAGHRCYVDLTFRKPNSELATARVVFGWSDETLAMETPGGPALNVQPLLRKAGWRRLAFKFDDRRAAISVDGDELAHGSGFGGPLVEIRFASEVVGASSFPEGLAAIFDDLSLVRFAEPSGRVEIDPTQDEVRLITGDQLFGQVETSGMEGVTLRVDGRLLRLGWAEVSGIYLRRAAAQSLPVEGKWARVEWRAAPGDDPIDRDRVEAALVSLDERQITFNVPYVGLLAIPRDRLIRIDFLSRTRRMMIDSTTRHLGDRVVADLDPPQAEGSVMEVGFKIDAPIAEGATLTLDVVQVIGKEGTPVYSDLVKKGELRTKLFLNGKPLDDLNDHVAIRNDSPIRVRIPVPAGVLVAGQNTLKIVQTGSKDEPDLRDNLGLSGIAIEFSTDQAGKP